MARQNGRFEQPFDSLDENDKEAQDELNALMIMARDQGRLHYENVVHNTHDADFLPVQQVNGSTLRLDYGVGKDASGLEQIIREVVKSSVNDEIEHLETHMGLPAGSPRSITTLSKYAITVDHLGRIGMVIQLPPCWYTSEVITGRIDYFLFYYRFSSSFLSTMIEDCLVTSAVFSSVVMDGLNEDKLLATVHNEYSIGLDGETYEQVEERQEKIDDIFEKALQDYESKSVRGESIVS
ncbi:hypothetical protein H2199_005786 [Coniosporium tulheliwenetii]|uniref:Uncharacterized protein n=1 Tax=Coniosporium tulheliwenetii TaxID=3383036 RepID=A0ACC2Z0E7_9PEZI|nr:hypothetical protein H2199_005786 [Cladosporium sp. JES 115]